MPATSPVVFPNPPAPTSPLRRISGWPVALLGLGLLITTGMAIQNKLFNRRFHEQGELALLDDILRLGYTEYVPLAERSRFEASLTKVCCRPTGVVIPC